MVAVGLLANCSPLRDDLAELNWKPRSSTSLMIKVRLAMPPAVSMVETVMALGWRSRLAMASSNH